MSSAPAMAPHAARDLKRLNRVREPGVSDSMHYTFLGWAVSTNTYGGGGVCRGDRARRAFPRPVVPVAFTKLPPARHGPKRFRTWSNPLSGFAADPRSGPGTTGWPETAHEGSSLRGNNPHRGDQRVATPLKQALGAVASAGAVESAAGRSREVGPTEPSLCLGVRSRGDVRRWWRVGATKIPSPCGTSPASTWPRFPYLALKRVGRLPRRRREPARKPDG